MSASIFQSINPIYIILLAPLFVFIRADYGVSYTELGVLKTGKEADVHLLERPRCRAAEVEHHAGHAGDEHQRLRADHLAAELGHRRLVEAQPGDLPGHVGAEAHPDLDRIRVLLGHVEKRRCTIF